MSYTDLTSKYEIQKAAGDIPWNVYPRPQMKRNSFICLNGTWELLIPGKKSGSIEKHEITVPFPPESKASGVQRAISPESIIAYSRTFTLKKPPTTERVILHFGAVDRFCRVYINNYVIGTHSGGYIPFSFDITQYLSKNTDENEIVVECEDGSDTDYPYGKQRKKRGGMWYTAISGIWQSVWMEIVPEKYIKSIDIHTTCTHASFTVKGGEEKKHLSIKTPTKTLFFDFTGECGEISIENPRLWSPDDPYLYRYTLNCGKDTVEGYFALREFTTCGKDFLLNGKPIFLNALLDQGYYSDGIFLPSSPDAYEDDILMARHMGFNTLRKHIKIEPMIFYHLCDKHGMLVMQDCINNGYYSFFRDTALPTIGIKKIPLPKRTQKERQEFIALLEEMTGLLASSPSVVYYTVFNEGWGQFRDDTLYDKIKSLSCGKVIDTASGWFKPQKSDVYSHHVYFKKVKLDYPEDKPTILSEFGGYSLKITDHTFSPKEYGYSKKKSAEELYSSLENLYLSQILPEIKKGLSGAVYTQLSDIEDEINGLVTYDRQVVKIPPKKLKKLFEKLYREFKDRER